MCHTLMQLVFVLHYCQMHRITPLKQWHSLAVFVVIISTLISICSADSIRRLNPATPNLQKIGSECLNDEECGLNARCIKRACRCSFGHVTTTPNNVNCSRFDCSGWSSLCQLRWPNAKCEYTSIEPILSECRCESNYLVDAATETCILKKVAIGQHCSSDNMCEDSAICYASSRTCQCTIGHYHNLDSTNCQPIGCSSNLDCHLWKNAICNKSQCSCPNRLLFDRHNLSCTLPLNNQTCKNNVQCDNSHIEIDPEARAEEDKYGSNILVIVLGIVFGVLVLVLIIVIILCCCQCVCFICCCCGCCRDETNPVANEPTTDARASTIIDNQSSLTPASQVQPQFNDACFRPSAPEEMGPVYNPPPPYRP